MSKTNETPSKPTAVKTPLHAALCAACLSCGLPENGADDISANLAMGIAYGFDGTLEALIEGTVERRLTARAAGAFVLDPAIADELTDALIAAAVPFAPEREDVADDDIDDDELWQDRILEQQELEDFEGAA